MGQRPVEEGCLAVGAGDGVEGAIAQAFADEGTVEIETARFANLEITDIVEEVAGVYPKLMIGDDTNAGAGSRSMVACLINDVTIVNDLIERITSETDALISE